MGFLNTLLKRPVAAPVVLAEYAECENVWATPTSRIHLRRLNGGPLVTGGGLTGRGITAACGVDVAWDLRDISRQAILDSLPNQHETFHYCVNCLDFLGLHPSI